MGQIDSGFELKLPAYELDLAVCEFNGEVFDEGK